MMKNALLHCAAAAAACLACTFTSVADTTIADVAPPDSFLVVSVRDWEALRGAFGQTGLADLWDNPAIQDFVKEIMDEPAKQFEDALAEIGAEKDDIKMPTGTVGLSLAFLLEDDELKAHALLMADFGDEADATQELLVKLLDHGVDQDKMQYDEDEYRDAIIYTISPNDADEEEPNWDTSNPFRHIEHFYVARSDELFVFSTRQSLLDSAIDGIKGDDVDAVIGVDAYQAALAQHPAGAHATAVFLSDPLLAVLRQGIAKSMVGVPEESKPDIDAIFGALGLLEIQAAGVAIRLNTDDAMMDQTYGIVVPKKTGLVALFDHDTEPIDPPAFVGSDTANVFTLQFNFPGMIPVIDDVINALPADQQQYARPGFDQFRTMAQQTLDALGPRVHVVRTYTKPYSGDSQQITVAIQVSDELVVSNLLAMFAPQGGFEARDFQGNQIYSSEMAPFAIGLGFGSVFIGNEPAVEDALRYAGKPDAPRLATEDRFTHAITPLDDEVVGFAFTDMDQTLRWTYWSIEHAKDIQETQLDAMGLDDETKQHILESFEDNQPDWMRHLPPVELLLEHLGDSAGMYQSTPDGFRGRSIWLHPD
jgi:hypothetical protein